MRGNQNLSRVGNCRKRLLSFDIYRQPFRFRLPDDSQRYRSCVGSLLSIATVATILLYAIHKAINSMNLNDYTVLQREYERWYDLEDKFGF